MMQTSIEYSDVCISPLHFLSLCVRVCVLVCVCVCVCVCACVRVCLYLTGMKGVLPSEASAAGNSSFAWVYLISLLLKHEKIDPIKSLVRKSVMVWCYVVLCAV